MIGKSNKGYRDLLNGAVTDPSIENKGPENIAGLECILNVIRALGMGSCLSSESRTPLPNSPLGIRKKRGSRKRIGSRSSSLEQLHGTPGRMSGNGSSEVASLFTQQGKKGPNQDAMVVWENFGSGKDSIFCGVFDGHGPFGHMVARRVRDSLPSKLSAHWEVSIKSDEVLRDISLNSANNMNSEATSLLAADEESRSSTFTEQADKQPEIFHTLKDSFLKAFKVMDRELKMHTNIDCFCSGTTAVTLVKQGQYLVIGNIGDSRAILGTREKNNSLAAVQLTVDLKPNLPAEFARIRKCRGRVFALRDEPDVSRVWLPKSDSPGLAMARAFGDFCLKDFGLISVPEITCRCLTKEDEFVVLATDGVWDVLSNKEVVDIVAAAPSRSSAARAVVESAVRAWRYRYPTSKVDDCAVVCLFLDSTSNGLSTASNAKYEDAAVVTELDCTGTVDNFEKSQSKENKGDAGGDDEEMELDSDIDWSALEGVSRVDTILTLPRFDPEKDAKRASARAQHRE